MPPKPSHSVRAILAIIDRRLAKFDDGAVELWKILTALRGPDDEAQQPLKSRTTTAIRRAAFPQVAAKLDARFGFGVGADFGSPETQYKQPEMEDYLRADHFASHVAAAARALGLSQ